MNTNEPCSWSGQYNILHIAIEQTELLLRKFEQTAGIGGAADCNCVQIHTSEFSDTRRNRRNECGLIALATTGNWSEERTVGFNKKPVFRNLAGTLVGRNRLGKGDCAAEADVEAELQELMHLLRSTAPAVHHSRRTDPLRSAGPQCLQHLGGRIAAVDDHGQIEFHSKVELRVENTQLLFKIPVSEEIEPQLADRDDSVILQCRSTQNCDCVVVPVLCIQWVDPNGITQLREAIGKGTDCRDFRWLNTRVKQSTNPCFSPTRRDVGEILVKTSEDDVTVAVNQRRYGRQNWVETRFRPILQSRKQQLAGWFKHFANRKTQTGLLIGTVITVQNTDLDRLVDSAERVLHRLLNVGLGMIIRAGAVGITSGEATLHQRAQRRFVSAVAQTIALSDFDPFPG